MLEVTCAACIDVECCVAVLRPRVHRDVGLIDEQNTGSALGLELVERFSENPGLEHAGCIEQSLLKQLWSVDDIEWATPAFDESVSGASVHGSNVTP